MTDEKVLVLSAAAVAVVASLCMRSCVVAKETGELELKMLCVQAGGEFEFGACNLPETNK